MWQKSVSALGSIEWSGLSIAVVACLKPKRSDWQATKSQCFNDWADGVELIQLSELTPNVVWSAFQIQKQKQSSLKTIM